MRVIDLTVVADRNCPTSRTYLTYLQQVGLRPRKLLLVDFLYDDAGAAKHLQRWGSRLGHILLQRRRAATPVYDPAFKQACKVLQKLVERPIDYFEDFQFGRYAAEVQTVTATDFSDAALHRRLMKQPSRTFLYTNGGRVPQSFLVMPGVRVLHIHPGVVPEVRGSDGLFWSLIVRGRPGVSCFFMDAGIDTGALIARKEFDRPDLHSLAGQLPQDPDVLYAALLHAYDPHLRASLLLDVLGGNPDLKALSGQPQPEGDEPAYCWMHPRLRRWALNRLLAGQPLELTAFVQECQPA